jgi:hypothetical protein
MARDEAAVVGVLPHGQAWTRSPPRFEHLGVWAVRVADPLEEVEDERVDRVGSMGAGRLAHAVNIGGSLPDERIERYSSCRVGT